MAAPTSHQQSPSTSKGPRVPRVRPALVPWIVLLAGLAASALFAREIAARFADNDRARFQQIVQEEAGILESRVATHMTLLTSAAGLFAGREPLTHSEFAAYVQQLQLSENYPGIEGLGFARFVFDDALESFVAATREEIDPQFDARPFRTAEEHAIVVYFEAREGGPHDPRGYDLSSQPGVYSAMERARNAARPAATGVIAWELIATSDTAVAASAGSASLHAKVIIFVAPVYEGGEVPPDPESRRDAIRGFVFCPFHPAALLADMFSGPRTPPIDLAAYEGQVEDRAQLLYASAPEIAASTDGRSDILRHPEKLRVADQLWTVVFTSRPDFVSASPRAVGTYVFLSGAALSVLLFVLAYRDTSLRRRSEKIHRDLLRREHAARTTAEDTANLLQIAEDAASAGVWELDIATGRCKWSDSLYRMYGADSKGFTPTLENWLLCIHTDDRARVRDAIAEAIEQHGELSVEYRVYHPDAGDRWLLEIGRTFGINEVGRPVRMAGIALDITSRKDAEEHQRLLLAELNHRVKNTLALVQSIASQTTKSSDSLDSFRDSFEGRLRALADAHGLATQSHWRSVDLRSLVHLALAPYASERGENTRMEGPPVALRTSAALALSMVLHELSTNAAKYGALSSPAGIASVHWTLEQSQGARMVHLTWEEKGGPPVGAVTRRGFGSRLIERSVQYDLGGHSNVEFRPEGFRCKLHFPLTAAASAPRNVVAESTV